METFVWILVAIVALAALGVAATAASKHWSRRTPTAPSVTAPPSTAGVPASAMGTTSPPTAPTTRPPYVPWKVITLGVGAVAVVLLLLYGVYDLLTPDQPEEVESSSSAPASTTTVAAEPEEELEEITVEVVVTAEKPYELRMAPGWRADRWADESKLTVYEKWRDGKPYLIYTPNEGVDEVAVKIHRYRCSSAKPC